MARRNRRRRGSRRGRARRPQGRQNFTLQIPYAIQVAEGSEDDITFDKLFGNKSDFILKNCPWRLKSVSFVVSNVSLTANDTPGFEPSILQVTINSGLNSNVEGISNQRYMVSHFPRRYFLRMRSPNPWKEDEQRSQSIITFQHIKYGQAQFVNSVVYALMSINIEFGRIPFTSASSENFARIVANSHIKSPPSESSCSIIGDFDRCAE